MRLIRTSFLFCLATLLILLSLANSEKVTLYFIPETLATLFKFKLAVNIPLFLVFFSGIFIGLVIGFVWEWLREYKFRAEANNYQKKPLNSLVKSKGLLFRYLLMKVEKVTWPSKIKIRCVSNAYRLSSSVKTVS